jgi:hypothetical protein
MTRKCDNRIAPCCFALLCCAAILPVQARSNDTLPTWEADEQEIARLGKLFEDERIRIRPPVDLQRALGGAAAELEKRGVYSYAWTPGGIAPHPTNFVVTLTPFAQPSSDALDKTVAGVQESVQRKLGNAEFAEPERGMFRLFEARLGTYRATIDQQSMVAIYLVGIDARGTFMVSTMIPEAEATPERMETLRAALLTFERAK